MVKFLWPLHARNPVFFFHRKNRRRFRTPKIDRAGERKLKAIGRTNIFTWNRKKPVNNPVRTITVITRKRGIVRGRNSTMPEVESWLTDIYSCFRRRLISQRTMLVSKCYNHQDSRKPPRISSRLYRTICTITAITPSRKAATWSEDYTHMSDHMISWPLRPWDAAAVLLGIPTPA